MEDLTGMQFGQWAVLYKDNNKQYKSRAKRWMCRCNCGTEKSVMGKYLKNGKSTSCGCSKKVDLTGQRFGRVTVIETLYNYNNSKRATYKCKCDCGNEIYLGISSLNNQISCGCLQNKSTMEEYVKNILNENKIEYVPQKRFDDCRDIFPLPFDFYLPQYNITIECDGIQHFEPVEHFGGEERLKVVQAHDQIKNNYCLTNNIKIIRLPYMLSFDKIHNIILNEIKILENPVTTTAI